MIMINCIIPTTREDYLRMRRDIALLIDYLQVDKIVFIAPEDTKALVLEDQKAFDQITFLWEEDLLPKEGVWEAYRKCKERLYGNEEKMRKSSAGWYYQQFLKLSYSDICDDKYYLSWDADTIPLHRLDMISPEGNPYFDVKKEWQESYFNAIQALFGFGKKIGRSFITEHMLFDVDLVKEMLSEILTISKSEKKYYEVIFEKIDNLALGFSEFETYGTWVAMRHQDRYRIRTWKSFRNANFFIERKDVVGEDIEWLAKCYDAASFEKYQKTVAELQEVFKMPRYREKLNAEQFYRTILESGMMGDYRDGCIVTEYGKFPV